MRKIKVAILGYEHVHAISMYNEFSKYPEKIELIGCADYPFKEGEIFESPSDRKLRVLGKREITLYEDYNELLDLKPDLVIVCSNIARYADIVEDTLSRGLNTVVEKPMAISYEDGVRMYKAYKNSTASLAVNWPVAWFDSFKKVKELVDAGAVGEVLRVHYRSPATYGAYNPRQLTKEQRDSMFWYHHHLGGGSSYDYACYGCTLSTWIFGRQAERVSGIKKNFFIEQSDVEDYAAYTLDFGRGVGVIEGSWSTINNGEIPTGPVVYGSKGVIVSDRYGSLVKVYKKFSHQNTEPDEVYEAAPWNNTTDNIALNFYEHIVNGKELNEMITPEFNLKSLAALDAGIRSSESGIIEPTKSIDL